MPTQTLIIFLIFFAGVLGLVVYFISSQLKKLKDELKGNSDGILMEWLKDMKTSVEKGTETVDRKLNEQNTTLTIQLKGQRDEMEARTKLIWQRLDNAQEVIRGVQNQLGGIQELGKDMKDLSNVLKSPKLRGGLGEQFLYDILGNILPKDFFKTQYKFKDGDICDAVIITEKGIIPIDSKFPMENFKAMLTAPIEEDRDRFKKAFVNDVKKRIDEISSKYILPEEHTTDQAIMYIPSENVYYELIVNTPQIEEYARQKNVLMASPNTLSYFLKVILIGYQRQELNKHTGEILKAISGIRIEAGKFSEELDVLGRHVSNTYKSMDGVKVRYQKLLGKIDSVQTIEGDKQAPLLED